MSTIVYTRRWVIEKGTIRHKIAESCLISQGNDPQSPTGDYEIFTDDGDMELWNLFEDTIEANKRAINKEERDRLLIVSELKRKRR